MENNKKKILVWVELNERLVDDLEKVLGQKDVVEKIVGNWASIAFQMKMEELGEGKVIEALGKIKKSVEEANKIFDK